MINKGLYKPSSINFVLILQAQSVEGSTKSLSHFHLEENHSCLGDLS